MKQTKKSFHTLTVTVSIFFILLAPMLYNSCQQSFQTANGSGVSSSSVSEEEALSRRQQLREKYCSGSSGESLKLINSTSRYPDNKVLVNSISPKTHLMVTIDNDCLGALTSEAKVNKLSKDVTIDKKSIPGLKLQAYGFYPPNDWSIEHLQLAASSDTCVLMVEENPEVNSFSIETQFNDALKSDLKHLDAVEAAEAYEILYGPDGISKQSSQRDVHVAVVDTGIDYTHPDLAQNIWSFTLPDDPNRAFYGIEIASLGEAVTNYNPIDLQGHGTAMAGIIGAESNNGIGVIGVMPYRVKLMAVKASEENPDVPGTEVLYTNTIVNGIRWAAVQGADVINLSNGEETLGPNGNLSFSFAIQEVIDAGVVVVAAAGNRDAGLRELDGNSLTIIPAIYGSQYDGMITVGASSADTKALLFNSVYSSKYVELAAPGSQFNGSGSSNGLMTTIPKALVEERSNYMAQEGTSVSAAMVSAAAGLVVGWVREKTGSVPFPCVVEGVLKESAESNSELIPFIEEGRHLNLYSMAQLLRELWP